MAKQTIEEQKALAEADLAVAQAEAARATAVKEASLARQSEALARKEEALAVKAEIDQRKAELEERERLAGNHHRRIYYFTAEVSSSSVGACIEKLDLWSRTEEKCEIEIIFTSPGGSVVDGMRLFDHIQLVRRAGHHVTTGTTGMAASMAGILLQAGDHRWMGSEAWVLIHEVQAGAMGSWGELEDRMDWLKRVQGRILDIFASRAALAKERGTAEKALTRKDFERNWSRKDWWLDSAECLKYGVVDEVR